MVDTKLTVLHFPIIIVAYYTRQGRNRQICGDSKVELQRTLNVLHGTKINGEYGKHYFLGDRDQQCMTL